MFIGKNVKLSHYHDTDGEKLANWQWNDDFLNLLTADVIHPFTAESWEKLFREGAESDENFEFTIRKVSDDQLIGFVNLSDISIRNRTANLGIGIPNAADQSQGFGSEALALILDYGFNNLNLHKIKLSVFDFNTAAIKAYTRVGFQKEGVSKQESFYNGHWVDLHHYAIFQDDWFEAHSNDETND
ncbi:GNAT family N-acetyltransferase [Fructobacillus ficulneus]|uniref:Acetyltransferase n=1 Tax=Fructobacillus ficulneus TaxID=157463 RepID=A0A0K8MJ64_9LACO|nr:GNAT family protein [Fructobacillus ficulneus]GAP00483.1 acetyltransferase [Fructobacillus ficulneus]